MIEQGLADRKSNLQDFHASLSPALDALQQDKVKSPEPKVIAENSPLLYNDLVAASPIFEEYNPSCLLASPRLSYKLRPREKNDGDFLNDDTTVPKAGTLEPVKPGTLIVPEPQLSKLTSIWHHIAISTGRCIWMVEKQIGAWADRVIDWLTQPYSS